MSYTMSTRDLTTGNHRSPKVVRYSRGDIYNIDALRIAQDEGENQGSIRVKDCREASTSSGVCAQAGVIIDFWMIDDNICFKRRGGRKGHADTQSGMCSQKY